MGNNEPVMLRQMTIEDTSLIVKWRNDPVVSQNLISQEPITEATHLKWIEFQVKTGRCRQFIIVEKESGRPIGSTFIKNIDIEKSTGEFGIFIGESRGRGKGYAKVITRLAVDHAFNELGLQTVYLFVFEDNIAGIKAYEVVGFARDCAQDEVLDTPSGSRRLLYMSLSADRWHEMRGMER